MASPTPQTEYVGGSGTSLVLLHGLGCSWRVWQPVIPALERHHRALAPTLPGHLNGQPWDPAIQMSVAALTDNTERWMDRHGLDRPHLVGNSLGGWISLELARRGRAASVTAFSPAGAWDPVGGGIRHLVQLSKAARAIADLLRPTFPLLLRRPKLRRAVLRAGMEHGERVPAAAAVGFLSDAAGCSAFDDLLAAFLRDGPIPGPVDVRHTPVRLLWGEHDRVIPLEPYGRLMAAAVPDAQTEVLPGVGHIPTYDNPALVARRILATTGAVPDTVVGERRRHSRALFCVAPDPPCQGGVTT